MSRTMAATGVVSALVALGCAGLLAGPSPTGPLRLDGLTADTCGSWSATATVPSHPRDWSLEVLVDGVPQVPVDVPSGDVRVSIGGYVGSAQTVTISVASEHASSAPIDLTLPPFDAALVDVPPLRPYPADQIPPIPLDVIGPCEVQGKLSVSATLQPGGRAVLLKEPVGPGDRVSFHQPTLAEGDYTVEASLWEGSRQIDTRVLRFEVGPPCVDADGDGYLACDEDCDDRRADVHPGVPDVSGDGIDNDCDGINGTDRDGDGAEDARAGGSDCDDTDPRVFGGQHAPPDPDGDGAYAWESLDWDCDGIVDSRPGPFDCDESNPAIPREEELSTPNGVDDNCDGRIDEGTVAYDDDGDGQAELEGDCDDTDPTVYAGASELGDCKDNDCDSEVDEGVARVEKDDRYEPNDAAPYELAGAVKKKRFLGFDTGYKPTHARLLLTSRDRSDIEQFSVWTHDGGLDTWHVTAQVEDMGVDRSYEIRITGEGETTSGVVSERGGAVTLTGSGLRNNTGTYTIELTPRDGERSWCPMVVVIRSG